MPCLLVQSGVGDVKVIASFFQTVDVRFEFLVLIVSVAIKLGSQLRLELLRAKAM